MDGPDEASACAACGRELDVESRCQVCSAGRSGVALTVLPRSSPAPVERPSVRLVRQLKMPAGDRLDLDAEGGLDRLPAVARSVAEALADGDLDAADRGLDDALGAVIAGPGHERRRREWGVLAIVLWGWCGVLLLVLLLIWVTSS